MCLSQPVPCLFTPLFPMHFLYPTGKGGVPSAPSNSCREWTSCPVMNVTRLYCCINLGEGWSSFSLSTGSTEYWWLGGLRKGSMEGISRNSFNLLWVTDEVTTGHGTDTCLWHPRPHVQLQSWNLIYWGAGCEEDVLNTMHCFIQNINILCGFVAFALLPFFLCRNVSCSF